MFFQQPDEEVDKCWAALISLNNNLTEVPADRQLLLQVRVGIASESTILNYLLPVWTTNVRIYFVNNIKLYNDYL